MVQIYTNTCTKLKGGGDFILWGQKSKPKILREKREITLMNIDAKVINIILTDVIKQYIKRIIDPK